ncbi:MAG: peptidyl-prolyl cis-trans isomerase C [Candidatus Endobugula sp.]|jgi:peptidyl-prolyl cis-trans isomerase C
MYKIMGLYFGLSLIFSTALQAQNTTIPSPATSDIKSEIKESRPVAKINADVITQSQADDFKLLLSQQLRGQSIDDGLLMEEIIKSVLLSQAAEKEGLDLRQDVIERINFQRMNMLAAVMLQSLVQRLQPSESELEEKYNEVPDKEFRINYIMVKDKTLALDIIAKLDNGLSFTGLAKIYSNDPTGKHGGNLGWVNGLLLNEALIKPLLSLKNKTYTTQPIAGNSGVWHIIQLLEKRSFAKPPYFQVREQLLKQELQQRLSTYINNLRANADITLNP